MQLSWKMMAWTAQVAVACVPAAAAPLAEREQAILRQCQQQIDANRKSDAIIRVVDAAGRPVSGAAVRAEQTRHGFLFGCYIDQFDSFDSETENEAYKRQFADLFNYATIGLFWRWMELEKGQVRYQSTDKIVDWCLRHRIEMKGHPLLCGSEDSIPKWSKGQPRPELQRKWIAGLLQRYHGKIRFWEVVNEPSHFSEPRIDEPYRWAREIDPTAYLTVNDYGVLADGCPPYFRLLRAAILKGIPLDGIGIQAHEPRTMRFPLDQVWRILDQYAALGKELHITEFTPTSGRQAMTGPEAEGVWDEAAQAEYGTKFYRVCFAHPAVRSITWWDLCERGAWLKGGGLLHADLTPKKAYGDLKQLIHTEWKSTASGKTDSAGRFTFRGFHGQYRISIQHDGATIGRELQLHKNGANRLDVRFTPTSSD